MKEIPIHPAAMLFPLMGEDELSKLADDISANGLLDPIVIYHGQILDGRNRLAACRLADIEPRFVEVDGDLPSATIYVLSKNLHRRHLTVSQRAAIAADMVPLLEEEAHRRQVNAGTANLTGKSLPTGSDLESGRSSAIAAKELQVGERTVARAVKVKREDPEAHERVKRGEITVNEASREQERRGPRKAAKPPRKDNSAPYEAKTERQVQRAGAQRERMISALSNVTGLCRGLVTELDLPMAMSVSSNDDRAMILDRAKESIKNLRVFISNFERISNA